jgi:hypothetical protein
MASPCPKPCSSPGIGRSNRRPAITTSRSHERQGRAAGYLIARGVTRVAPGPPMTMVAGFRYHSLERLSGASRRGPLLVKSCELARFRRLDLLWVASRRGASDVTSH